MGLVDVSEHDWRARSREGSIGWSSMEEEAVWLWESLQVSSSLCSGPAMGQVGWAAWFSLAALWASCERAPAHSTRLKANPWCVLGTLTSGQATPSPLLKPGLWGCFSVIWIQSPFVGMPRWSENARKNKTFKAVSMNCGQKLGGTQHQCYRSSLILSFECSHCQFLAMCCTAVYWRSVSCPMNFSVLKFDGFEAVYENIGEICPWGVCVCEESCK